MYDDMMVEPTERHEVIGVGIAALGPVDSMMGLEPVAAGASFGTTAAVSTDHELAKATGNLGGSAARVEWFAVIGHGDGFDGAAAEDLFERVGADQLAAHERANRYAGLLRVHEDGDAWSGAFVDPSQRFQGWESCRRRIAICHGQCRELLSG